MGKGQISTVMIIAFFILIGTIITIGIYTESRRDLRGSLEAPSNLVSLQDFGDSCALIALEESLTILSYQGGVITIGTRTGHDAEWGRTIYWMDGPQDIRPSTEVIIAELEHSVEERFTQCISTQDGMRSPAVPQATIMLTTQAVKLSLHAPITLQKGPALLRAETFEAQVRMPLQTMLDDAETIRVMHELRGAEIDLDTVLALTNDATAYRVQDDILIYELKSIEKDADPAYPFRFAIHLHLQEPLTNHAPIITMDTTPLIMPWTPGTRRSITFTATDEDHDELVYWTEPIIGDMDPLSGTWTYTPPEGAGGELTIHLFVSDGSLTSHETYTILIGTAEEDDGQ